MPRGFLVKRQYMDTLQHHHQQASSARHHHSSTEDYSDHSTSSEDVPTDLSKRHHHHHHHHHLSPPIIHPYPPLPSSLFQPHLDFHSMVVERLQQRFEQQHCLYPETTAYPDYFLPPLYHRLQAPVLTTATSSSSCTPGAAGGLLLDLTIKASTPITPPATPSPVTSATVPSSKRPRSAISEACTPDKIKSTNSTPTSSAKKIKAVRRLHFDEDKSSPVSGTIIRELSADEPPLVVRKGDIDPAFNVVEVTEEAKAELAKIENRIGDYICKLCCEMYDDAFSLAQHRCSRIVHVEYRCPECDKVFNCPANLASHRRWHKPRPPPGGTASTTTTTTTSSASAATQHLVSSSSIGEPVDLVKRQSDSSSSGDEQDTSLGGNSVPLYPCDVCHKRFRRQAYLKKHLATHNSPVLVPSPPPPPPPPLLLAPQAPQLPQGVMCAPAPPPLHHPPPPQMLLAD